MYPNQRQPNYKIFKRLYDNLGETGSLTYQRNVAGRPRRIFPEQEGEILVRVADNDEIFTQRLSAATGLTCFSVFRILKREYLHTHHFNLVQSLLLCDLPARLKLGPFIIEQQNTNPAFVSKILFTDKATFTTLKVLILGNSKPFI